MRRRSSGFCFFSTNCLILVFICFGVTSSSSKSKNAAGETSMTELSLTINSKEGFLSPRSTRPKCFGSIPTASATWPSFSFCALRLNRTSAPNLAASSRPVSSKRKIKSPGVGWKRPIRPNIVDKSDFLGVNQKTLSIRRQSLHCEDHAGELRFDDSAHFVHGFELWANNTPLDVANCGAITARF